MAENVAITPGTGDVVAADDIGGVKFQRIKMALGTDGTNDGDVSSTNPMPVTQSGVATSAKQDTGNTSLASIDGKITAVNTGAVVVSSSALPSGAATSAKQDTGNTSVASIDTKTPSLGQALAAASVPVILPAATITTLTPPAAITGFATSAKQDTGNTSLSSIDSKITAVNTGAVVVSSSALPSGAATAAKQPALGTAGSASADVITVQGIASGTAQPVSGTVTANAGTNLNTSALALETGGNLAAIKTDVDKIPSQGQALAAASMPVVLPAAQITTLTPPSNTGYALDATLTAGNQQVQGNVASAATDSGSPVKVGGRYNSTKPTFTDGQRGDLQIGTKGSVSVQLYNVDSGTAEMFLADNANAVAASATANKMAVVARDTVFNGTTWDLAPGDATNGAWVNIKAALPAGTALVGKVGIDQTTPGTTNAVVDTPVTSGGLSVSSASVGATATSIKASAGQIYGWHLFNTTAAVAYVQFFDLATGSVTLGTTVPKFSIGIPASGGATINFDKGIPFATAISYACTTTRTGLTGATCDVNFFYK